MARRMRWWDRGGGCPSTRPVAAQLHDCTCGWLLQYWLLYCLCCPAHGNCAPSKPLLLTTHTHPLTKMSAWLLLSTWICTGLSPRQYLFMSSMVRFMVVREGLLSWKRSPPSSSMSTSCCCASCRISSKARKESCLRSSSFSHTP